MKTVATPASTSGQPSALTQLLQSSHDMQGAIEMLLRVCGHDLRNSPGIVALAQLSIERAALARTAAYMDQTAPCYHFHRLTSDDTEGGST